MSLTTARLALVATVFLMGGLHAMAQQKLQLNNTADQYFVIQTPLAPNAGPVFEYSLTAWPGILPTSVVAINPNAIIVSDANGQLTDVSLQNGQVLIGVTGGSAVGSTLTAGSGVSITNAAGAITISASGILPVGTTNDATLRWDQASTSWFENPNVLASSAGNVTATTATLGATTNQLQLGTTLSTTLTAPVPAASRVYTISDVGSDAAFVMTEGSQVVNGAKTFLGNIELNSSGSGTTVIGSAAGNGGAISIRSVGVTSADITMTVDSTNNADLVLESIKQDETATQYLVLDGSNQLRRRTATPSVPTSTTNDATLRWNQATTTWQANTNVLATAAGALTAVTAGLSATSDQLILGTTLTTTLSAPAPAASRVYTISDVGANASFVMTEGTQTVNGAKTHLGTVAVNTSGSGTTTIGSTAGSGGAITIQSAGASSGDITMTVDSANSVDLILQNIKQDQAGDQVLVLDATQQVRRRSAASLAAANQILFSEVAAQQINANAGVYTNATGLVAALEANKTYSFQLYVICERQNNNAGNMQFQFTVPAGAAGTYGWLEENSGDGRPTALITTASTATIDGNGVVNILVIEGVVRNGATAGDIQFQFRRTGANQEMRVNATSFMTAQKLN